jgi:catechol 2,3-dioxygenase-like lactoylglutathione lyase family enzyme
MGVKITEDLVILKLDHVQIAAPEGCEAAAREFYGGILGMRELDKPGTLRGRGGCWFQCGEQQLHVGVEAKFRAAKKAHPAFAVDDLDGLRARLGAHGVKITEDDALPHVDRFYAEDPWGNRLEFLKGKRG